MKVKIFYEEETLEKTYIRLSCRQVCGIFLINDWRGRISPMQGNATPGQGGLKHIRKVAE